MKCSKCQAELSEGSRFCNGCGEEQVPSTEGAEVLATVEETPAETPKKKPFRKLPILILSAALLLLIIGVVLFFVLSQPRPHNYMLYIKDGDLYYSAVSEIAPLRVSDGPEEIGAREASRTVLTQDGRYLFYLNRDSMLYRRDLSDPESRSERIASDVVSYFVSADGRTVLFMDREGTLSIRKNGARAEKLDDTVSEVVHVDKTLGQIYYLKEGALYSSTGKRGKWIASDVLDVMVFDSGELYYLKENKAVTISAKDLIDHESVIAYLAERGGTVVSEEDFWRTMDAQLKDCLDQVQILYHRDANGNVSRVCENYLSAKLADAEEAVLVYVAYEPSATQKMKLAVEETDLSAILFKLLSSVQKAYIAVGEHAVSLGVGGNSSFFMDDACKYLCYLVHDADLSAGTLCRAEISARDIKEAEKVDGSVCAEGVFVTRNGKCFYLKDAQRNGSDLSADLYCDGKRICREISTSDITYEPTTDRVLFFSDWSSTDLLGTLMYDQDGEVVTIADEVHDYACTPAGDVLYLTNWNAKQGYGDLYLYRDGESEPIDDAVSAIIPVG